MDSKWSGGRRARAPRGRSPNPGAHAGCCLRWTRYGQSVRDFLGMRGLGETEQQGVYLGDGAIDCPSESPFLPSAG